MNILRILLLSVGLFQVVVTKAGPSVNLDYIAKALKQDGAPFSFLCNGNVRLRIARHEAIVGYEKCRQDYYDVLCRVAEESAQQNDSLMYDLGMSRHFMEWQNGMISTPKALSCMKKLMEDCNKRFGDKSFEYSTALCILAVFYCASGNFDEVDKCCHRILNYDSYESTAKVSQVAKDLHVLT